MSLPMPLGRRLLRVAAIVLAALLLLVLSGLLLADHLTPQAQGAPSHVLPLQPAQTRIDQQIVPLQDAHPGQSGVAFLSDGMDAFAARAMITAHAGRSLDLQYYIWHDDLIGHLMAKALHDAAERGVRVRILLDDMNAKDKDALMMALDRHPNIEIRLYNPFRNRTGILRVVEMVQRFFSVNHRMHNKSWIADGRVAIVGGRNIGEEYFSARTDVNFQDLDLLVAGPAVEQANRIFDDYWNSEAAIPVSALAFHTDAQLRLLVRESDHEAQRDVARPYLARVAESRQRQRPSPEPLHWSSAVRIVSDPPMKHRSDDRAAWLVSTLISELQAARHKALLISPYFVPGNEGLDGFSAMAGRGVQVGVVTNSLAANDVAAVHGGYMSYRVPLLEAGVHLYELKAHGQSGDAGMFGSSGASLHTKAFVVDDRRGFVGSFNLDPRSAYLNTEMGVLFDDPVLGAQLRDEYLRLADPRHSWWLALDDRGLRWLEREPPPHWVEAEPGASLGKRWTARAISWLPVESQL
ncbi:phospholipase D family protein [Stenotrophomonas maltophilia]|nr:phospholipase D family protein [Stenotrophomonas maltophilia]MBN7835979.1 phospholipase D family protein [Stenotrophomonas maltophilia]MBN7860108.1 phospholipase D family protein [Stenotrophomonas maltophilia]MBN7918863.1 phospholipase D family protein [Stenotrophomonas maltophilia]MBO2847480.1 phospholipase D family protein [Stenotrophomonas maltophilia]